MKEIKVDVTGMMCGHCEAHVKSALEALAGVESAKADHEKGVAMMQVSSDIADSDIKSAIEKEGYEVTGITR